MSWRERKPRAVQGLENNGLKLVFRPKKEVVVTTCPFDGQNVELTKKPEQEHFFCNRQCPADRRKSGHMVFISGGGFVDCRKTYKHNSK